MSVHSTARNPAILSYYLLRKLVGIIALALPFALVLGSFVAGLLGPEHALPHPLLLRSVSDYYFSPVRDLFEGGLWVIAFFLICSRGYDLHDEISGYLAGILTLGVALFPSFDPRLTTYTQFQLRVGYIHTAFAALMFLSVAYFCLVLFRRSSLDRRKTRRKRIRNTIYGVCGVVILACNVTMISLTLKGLAHWTGPLHPVLCCESLALIAFGVAWLTKGEGLLRDLPHERVRRHMEMARQ